MFAPEINITKNQITTLFNEISGVTAYSIGVQDTMIGTLHEEPKWIPEVRSEMKLLSNAGANWIIKFPESWVQILTPFADYASDFSAFSSKIKDNLKTLTKDEVVELLSELSSELQSCANSTRTGLENLTDFENKFTNVFPALNDSIQSGWQELGEEEAEMIAIAQAITRLQDEISSLQSKINSSNISGAKSFGQTTVKIVYSVVTAVGEVAVPYLSIVTLAYTIGKSFYEIIADTEEINKDLVEIGQLQLKASWEAQAAAATKATIQYLYNIENQFLSLKKHGSGLLTMWKNEKSKIDEAIDATNAGADPTMFLDILTMDIANKNWSELLNFTTQILNIVPKQGRDVILQTQLK